MNVVVLGAGESGVGAAMLGKVKGHCVWVSDKKIISPIYRAILESNEIDYEQGNHSKEKLFNADLIIKSPGIPDDIDLIKILDKKGIPIISEIEFAAMFSKAPIIGITGSNGKTTTSMMIKHILDKSGLNTSLAGNIGNSYAREVIEDSYEYYVLELSSFQLDGIVNFHPHIAVLTNITPDHLDRYNSNFQAYVDSKFRIVMNQTQEDYFIYDSDDNVIIEGIKKFKPKSRLIAFSLKNKLENGIYVDNSIIKLSFNSDTLDIRVSSLPVRGIHNLKNAIAAIATACIIGIPKKNILDSFLDFKPAEHRLEPVLKINDVQYINDSKATNVNATFYALDSMKTPTIWIVGGVDKENDYCELISLVRKHVKAIICIGFSNEKIYHIFKSEVDIIQTANSMSEAVKKAHNISKKGDCVLLSPACASFDLFENYQDRGIQFKEEVKKL